MAGSVKERGILFSGEMVRAILEGRKTQTRRVMKIQPVDRGGELRFPWASFWPTGHVHTWDRSGIGGENWNANQYPGENKFAEALRRTPYENPCPYGKPGDLLYVRETHFIWGAWFGSGKTKTGKQRWTFVPFTKDVTIAFGSDGIILAKHRQEIGWHRRPSLFLPKNLSRIWLEITGVRVERLQEIQGVHVIAEGIAVNAGTTWESRPDNLNEYARRMFKDLWDSLNKKRGFGWDKNPWVWVIEFRRIKP